MLDYIVEVPNRAEKDLKKNVAHQDRKRVVEAIDALAEDPRPHGCVKVRLAKDTFRVRVGDYRIIYIIWDSERKVTIARVKRRSEDTYKNL